MSTIYGSLLDSVQLGYYNRIHLRASPSGKALASQANTREFESRRPLLSLLYSSLHIFDSCNPGVVCIFVIEIYNRLYGHLR